MRFADRVAIVTDRHRASAWPRPSRLGEDNVRLALADIDGDRLARAAARARRRRHQSAHGRRPISLSVTVRPPPGQAAIGLGGPHRHPGQQRRRAE